MLTRVNARRATRAHDEGVARPHVGDADVEREGPAEVMELPLRDAADASPSNHFRKHGKKNFWFC